MENTVKSIVKCPKCKSINLELIEIWSAHTITWQQVEGKLNLKEGNLEAGDPYKVEASCMCGHKWKIRKALQISDIIN